MSTIGRGTTGVNTEGSAEREMARGQRSAVSSRAAVAGLFDDRESAGRAVHALKDAGFGGDQIGLSMRDGTAEGRRAADTGTHVAEGAMSGADGGGTLVTVQASGRAGEALDILERYGADTTTTATTRTAEPASAGAVAESRRGTASGSVEVPQGPMAARGEIRPPDNPAVPDSVDNVALGYSPRDAANNQGTAYRSRTIGDDRDAPESGGGVDNNDEDWVAKPAGEVRVHRTYDGKFYPEDSPADVKRREEL